MSELSEAIIKIVKSDPDIGSAINAAVNPAKIYSRRGMAYVNDSGAITAKGGSEGSSEGAPGAGQETDPENTDRTDNAPGITGVGGGGGESKTAAAVNDTKKGDQTKDVTGSDYTTGSDDGNIKVKLNSIDDAARDNPGGWPDPDSPPTVSDWVSGREWLLQQSPSAAPDFATKSQVQAWGAANLEPAGFSLSGTDTQWYGGANRWNGENFSTYTWSETVCTPTPGDPTCPTVAPVDDWPTDGQCHLSWDTATGTFKGNAYDADCSGAQITGTAEVYIEDSGVRKKISHLANGGFKITDVDASNVDDPAGYTRIYSPDGILQDIYTTDVGAQVE